MRGYVNVIFIFPEKKPKKTKRSKKKTSSRGVRLQYCHLTVLILFINTVRIVEIVPIKLYLNCSILVQLNLSENG